MRTLLRIVVAVVAGIGFLFAASTAPAHADSTYTAWTDEDDGKGIFNGSGEHLYACDYTFDGETTVAELWSDGELREQTFDWDGSGGDCGHDNLDIVDGTTLYFRVCNGWDTDIYECSNFEKVTA